MLQRSLNESLKNVCAFFHLKRKKKFKFFMFQALTYPSVTLNKNSNTEQATLYL